MCSQSDLDKINTSEVTGKFCRERNSTEPDKLRGGMGDIFVKLSLVGTNDNISQDSGHNTLKNIYGESLKQQIDNLMNQMGNDPSENESLENQINNIRNTYFR